MTRKADKRCLSPLLEASLQQAHLQSWRGLNVYGCQETDRGLARCADKVTGGEGVSVVVQCTVVVTTE